jgi:hypothetical protein
MDVDMDEKSSTLAASFGEAKRFLSVFHFQGEKYIGPLGRIMELVCGLPAKDVTNYSQKLTGGLVSRNATTGAILQCTWGSLTNASSNHYYAINADAFALLLQGVWRQHLLAHSSSSTTLSSVPISHVVSWFLPEFSSLQHTLSLFFSVLREHQTTQHCGQPLGFFSSGLPAKLAGFSLNDVVFIENDIWLYQQPFFQLVGLNDTNFTRKTARQQTYSDEDLNSRRLWTASTNTLHDIESHLEAGRGRRWVLPETLCGVIARRNAHVVLLPELQKACQAAIEECDRHAGLELQLKNTMDMLDSLPSTELTRPEIVATTTTFLERIGRQLIRPQVQRSAERLHELRKSAEWQERVFGHDDTTYLTEFVDAGVVALCKGVFEHGEEQKGSTRNQEKRKKAIAQGTITVSDSFVQTSSLHTVSTPRSSLMVLEAHRLASSARILEILRGIRIGARPRDWSSEMYNWRPEFVMPRVGDNDCIHVFIDNCGKYRFHLARSNIDSDFTPRLHTAIFIIIVRGNKQSPQMKPLSTFEHPTQTIADIPKQPDEYPSLEKLMDASLNDWRKTILRESLSDGVQKRIIYEQLAKRKYCAKKDCLSTYFAESAKVCGQCASKLRSCRLLVQEHFGFRMKVTAKKKADEMELHNADSDDGSDSESETEDKLGELSESDEDDDEWSEDDEYAERDSEDEETEEKKANLEPPNSERKETVAAAAPPPEVATNTSSSEARVEAKTEPNPRSYEIYAYPMLHKGQSQSSTEEVLDEVPKKVLTGNRKWVNATGDLVTLAYIMKASKLVQDVREKFNIIGGTLHEHMHNLRSVTDVMIAMLVSYIPSHQRCC